MKSFPDKLRPENREHFLEYKFNRDLCKFRAIVYEYIISEVVSQPGGLDLKTKQDMHGEYTYGHVEESIVDTICEELQNLGWKTKKAYGNSVLFIYKHEKELPRMSDTEEIGSLSDLEEN